MSSRREEKERRRQERLAREAAEQRAAGRRRRLQMAGGIVGVLAVAAIVVALVAPGEHAKSPTRRSGSGLLASTAGGATGAAIDGIRCQTNEQAIFHIHAHVAVYVNRHQRAVPEGIGIPPPRSVQQSSDGPFVVSGACFYWLHSHTRDGIIHIESPVQRVYTLGNYFDIWKQPLGPRAVGPAKGPVTAYLNRPQTPGEPEIHPVEGPRARTARRRHAGGRARPLHVPVRALNAGEPSNLRRRGTCRAARRSAPSSERSSNSAAPPQQRLGVSGRRPGSV